jgi:hypothetical protein
MLLGYFSTFNLIVVILPFFPNALLYSFTHMQQGVGNEKY